MKNNSVYKVSAELKANDLVMKFGKKNLAIACIDEILDELTNLDGRCKFWREVKSNLNNSDKVEKQTL